MSDDTRMQCGTGCGPGCGAGTPDETSTPAAVPTASGARSPVRSVFGPVREAIVSQLSHAERLLVVLWYVEQMTPTEIAQVLEIPAPRVESMHGEILGKLRTGASGGRAGAAVA